MGTGKPRISTVAAEPADRVVRVELAPGRGLAELELGQVAVLDLVIGLVRAELEHAQVVAELELAQEVVELQLVLVAVELEHGPEVLVPARGHPRAQLAVAPRTKSVTGARRRDLVLRLAAEDLAAAAAETTREPAAAEAVIVWEVAE
jgi:hypothetical protein